MPRIRHSRRAEVNQALAMQAAYYRVCLKLEQDLNASTDRRERASLGGAMANLSKAWTSTSEQIRILKMRPLPGSLKPDQSAKPTRLARPRRARDYLADVAAFQAQQAAQDGPGEA